MASSFFPKPLNFSTHHQFWKKLAVGASVVVAVGGTALVGAHLIRPKCGLFASLSDPLSHSRSWIQPLNNSALSSLACLSAQSPTFFTEPKTGLSFPTTIDEGEQQLAGTGLRKKSILGLKNITVYAFGVYANEASLKDKLGSKYMQQSVADLKESKLFYEDILASDFDLTVRLVIVYGRLKVGSVRSAFEESIGSRIKKFSGTENRPLLESFTTLFRDDIQLPRGTTIDITRHSGHVLKTKIDGAELGTVQSPLLCRAFLDLYMGEEPFDIKGKEDIGLRLASVIGS